MHLSNYMEIEERIMDKIWRRFGLDDLTEEENRRWKQVDDDVLKLELMVLIEGEENAVCEELCSCPICPRGPGGMWRKNSEIWRRIWRKRRMGNSAADKSPVCAAIRRRRKKQSGKGVRENI